MLELFNQFTLQQIIVFIILLALAIKGCVSFFDWMTGKNKDIAKKMNKSIEIQTNIEKHTYQIQNIKDSISSLTSKIDLLVMSDRDAIKAFITRQHHYFCYQKKWIDDYSLDCIERRYVHYKEEQGNSFIDGLMEELRNLPKKPMGSED